MRKGLQKMNTNKALTDTICSCLTEWMDTNTVTIKKYPQSHCKAVLQQTQLGWQHFFTGHISLEWNQLYLSEAPNNRYANTWSTKVIIITIESTIKLWLQRNEDLHGATDEAQQNSKLDRLKTQIRRIFPLQSKCLQKDHNLFRPPLETLLEATSVNNLQNWISIRLPRIRKSIKTAKEHDLKDTDLITKWFTPTTIPPRPTKDIQQDWDNLLFDPFSKKKRHKTNRHSQRTKQSKQSLISTFFQPHQP